MKTWAVVLLIILAVLVVLAIILAIVGSKLQKKQDASEEQMRALAQTVSILVLDKKKIKLKDSNVPKIVLEQTPKYLQRSKVPIVKAKVGPNVMDFMCDAKIFDIIPVKKEVKAQISGIYICDVKGLRGGLDTKPNAKPSFRDKLLAKKKELDAEAAKEKKEKEKKKKK